MQRKFTNKTKINRVKHDAESPYTCITNALIQDDRLNATEIGIMLKLLSNADSYILNSTYFMVQTGIKNRNFYKCWNHLIALGYINKRKIQSGYEWVINEIPNPSKSDANPDESTPCENNPDEITPDESEALINTNETSINETTTNETTTNELNKNESNNITRDTSTSIFSGKYTGTSILGHEVEEIISKVLSTKENASDKIKIFYFKEKVKNMLRIKVEATGCFEGMVSPYIVKKELNSLKERLDPEYFKSIEPLLIEYIKCIY